MKYSLSKNKCSRIYEKVTSIYISFLLTIYLLYVGNGGYQNISVIKFKIYSFSSCIYILFILLLSIEMILIGCKNFKSLIDDFKNISWIQKLILLYLLFTIISTALSQYKDIALSGGTRFEGLFTIMLYCLSFLFISMYVKPSKNYVYIFAVSMTIFCCISIIQLLGYNPFNLYPEGYNYYDGNIKYSDFYIGTVGNIGFASALLCLAIPIFFVGIIRFNEKRKYFLLIPLILCITVLFAIKVQAGILGVIVGTILFLPFVLNIKPKVRKIIFLIILLFIVMSIIFIWFYDFNEIGTFYELHELLHGNFENEYGTGRIYIWKNVVKLIPEKLLFGGGPDTLSKRMTTHFERYNNELGLTIYALIDAAHNEYLNIFVNQGLLALVCYLLALVFEAIMVIKKSENTDVMMYGGAMLCYSIQAFFGIGMCIISIFFWLTWGLVEKTTKN